VDVRNAGIVKFLSPRLKTQSLVKRDGIGLCIKGNFGRQILRPDIIHHLQHQQFAEFPTTTRMVDNHPLNFSRITKDDDARGRHSFSINFSQEMNGPRVIKLVQLQLNRHSLFLNKDKVAKPKTGLPIGLRCGNIDNQITQF